MLDKGNPTGAEWVMVQHGGAPGFNPSKQEEEEAWKAQYEVGSQIQAALERAFQLHKTTDFEISSVSAFPGTRLFLILFVHLPVTLSTRSV